MKALELFNSENLKKQWDGFNELSKGRQLGIVLGIAAGFTLILAALFWPQQPQYKALFKELEAKDANKVVEILQKENIPYQLDENSGQIMVAESAIHKARLKLAAQGLPNSTGVGFESLQEPQSFGTSQFLETARFHRALEVELARTIMEISAVEQARVHLALPKQSVFVRDRREPSASVMIKLRTGRTLEDEQVKAIVHMVASSVQDMTEKNVTIVDQSGNLLTTKKNKSQDMELSASQFDYGRRVEQSYIERIEGILSPIVGVEGVRAQVVADIDFTQSEQTQETFNPDTPAVRSQQTQEEETVGMNGGVPGALSNQPPGAASVPETLNGDTATPATPISKKKQATNNYEVDRTLSHVRNSPTRLRRLSVAVVVDDRFVGVENGAAVRRPHTPEELERITGLVKEAIGFNVQRGDSVNVINSSFLKDHFEPLPDIPWYQRAWGHSLINLGVATLLVILLFILVLRPMLKGLSQSAQAARAEEEADLHHLLMGADGQMLPAGSADLDMLPVKSEEEQRYQSNLDIVKKHASEDPRRVAQVLKNWVDGDG